MNHILNGGGNTGMPNTEKLAYKIYDDTSNSLIANIYYTQETNTYRADLIKRDGYIPLLFGFPEIGSRPNPESQYIENFLSARVIPPNRDFLKEILHLNNLYEYDWKELIKLNKGRTTDDGFRVEVVE